MQIILNQAEIEQALVAYISTRLAINSNQEVAVELTAGRGADGYRAMVEIKDAVQAAPVAPAPAVATPRKPKAASPALEQPVGDSKPQPEKDEPQTENTDAPFDGGTDTSDPESGATADVAEVTQVAEKPTDGSAVRRPLFGRSAAALNA